jgi:triacylglycerol lipase
MATFAFDLNTTRYDSNTALWLGKAAHLAYQDEPSIGKETSSWGFDRFRFFSKRETQAFVIANDKMIVVAFRGTEPGKLRDWLTDVDLTLVDGPVGKVHDGFNRALTYVYQDVRQTIAEFQTKGQSLWFTGHSLGAALATLAVAKLRHEEDKPVYGLYTFGQPRTGDRTFERNFNADFKSRAFRFVNNNDIVPRVPPRELGYSHVGTFLHFDSAGNLQSDISWWYRLLDGARSRIEDFLKLRLDDVEDHAMRHYLERLEKNIDVRPQL